MRVQEEKFSSYWQNEIILQREQYNNNYNESIFIMNQFEYAIEFVKGPLNYNEVIKTYCSHTRIIVVVNCEFSKENCCDNTQLKL